MALSFNLEMASNLEFAKRLGRKAPRMKMSTLCTLMLTRGLSLMSSESALNFLQYMSLYLYLELVVCNTYESYQKNIQITLNILSAFKIQNIYGFFAE